MRLILPSQQMDEYVSVFPTGQAQKTWASFRATSLARLIVSDTRMMRRKTCPRRLEGWKKYSGHCRVTADLGHVSERPMRGSRVEGARASCVSHWRVSKSEGASL
jgi:hypothetical protein